MRQIELGVDAGERDEYLAVVVLLHESALGQRIHVTKHGTGISLQLPREFPQAARAGFLERSEYAPARGREYAEQRGRRYEGHDLTGVLAVLPCLHELLPGPAPAPPRAAAGTDPVRERTGRRGQPDEPLRIRALAAARRAARRGRRTGGRTARKGRLRQQRGGPAGPLPVLAVAGHEDPDDARRAYAAGITRLLPGSPPPYDPPRLAGTGWSRPLDRALARLDGLSWTLKEGLVEALAVTLRHDGRVTLEEAELLRAICGSLHCPLPIFHAALGE